MSKPQLHASQISTLHRCGIQFENRYVKGIIRPPGVALVVGSATHKSIEKNMLYKIESGGKLLAESDIRDIARDDLNKRWENDGVELNEMEKTVSVDSVRGAAVDEAVALSVLHHKELAPVIEPEKVERRWVVELKGFPFDLSGMIDLQETKDKDYRIHDTKTAGKSPPKNTAHNSEQLSMYSLASLAIDGRLPPLQLDNLVKSKVPKVVIQETTRTKEDLKVTLARIEAAAKSIESGIFLPAPADSWQCNPAYCGYFNQCKFAHKRVFSGPSMESE